MQKNGQRNWKQNEQTANRGGFQKKSKSFHLCKIDICRALLRIRSFTSRRFSTRREKWSDDKAQAPIWPAARTVSINLRTEGKLHRQFADLNELTDRNIDRNNPLFRPPIIRRFRVQPKAVF